VQIPAARIYNLPTARMYSFVCPSDSPPGGSRTVPRTVSRTALREDLRNSNGHPDSPSALRNYFAGREREARQVYGMCMRARMRFVGSPLTSIYRKAKGQNWHTK